MDIADVLEKNLSSGQKSEDKCQEAGVFLRMQEEKCIPEQGEQEDRRR